MTRSDGHTRLLEVIAATVACALLLVTMPAHADGADETLKRSQAAYDAGKFEEALQAADAGLAVRSTDGLKFMKARSSYKLNKIDEAWELFQQIQPNKLPDDLQDPFVAEYAIVEAVAKDRAKQAKDKDKDKDKDKNKDDGGAPTMLWVASGASVAIGGVLMMMGANAGKDANTKANNGETASYGDDYDSGKGMHTAGIALIAVGAGLGAWAAYETFAGGGGKTARWQLLPTPVYGQSLGTGLVFTRRF